MNDDPDLERLKAAILAKRAAQPAHPLGWPTIAIIAVGLLAQAAFIVGLLF